MSAAAADVRVGGRWSPGQRLKNTCIRAAVRALLAIADALPAALLLASCRTLGLLAALLSPRLLGRAEARARTVLPEAEARRVARACFGNAGANLALALLMRRPGSRASDFVRLEPSDRQLLEAAGGAVVVSAHLGPFELIAPAVRELGLPAVVVVRESYDPELDPHVDAHRRRHGVAVIHRGDPGAATRMLRGLRSGGLLGLLADLPARVERAEVSLLGQRAELPIGPARVARAARVPLLAACLVPEERRRFRLKVVRIRLEGACDVELTQRVADALGAAITAAPEHWLWMAG